MKCPYCFQDNNKVLEHSRKLKQTTDRGVVLRRKRKCLSCGESFYTIEYIKRKGGKET